MINRIPRSFSCEMELVKALDKESNASDLINRLLKEHYKRSPWDGMSDIAVEKAKEKLKTIIQLKKEIKELANGRDLFTL